MIKSLYGGEYTVDENGIIYSQNKYRQSTILKGKVCKVTGYRTILFSFNKERKYRLAHRVVAEAFIPNPLNYPEVNHIDGNKLNNAVSNLEWVTARQNQLHNRDILANTHAKITFEKAEAIRRDKTITNASHRILAAKYGLSKTHIGDILSGKRWAI